jgi:hypothetical protein
MDQQESRILAVNQRGPRRNMRDISPINFISPICSHSYRKGPSNDDISSEEHFETSRGSYFYLKPSSLHITVSKFSTSPPFMAKGY